LLKRSRPLCFLLLIVTFVGCSDRLSKFNVGVAGDAGRDGTDVAIRALIDRLDAAEEGGA